MLFKRQIKHEGYNMFPYAVNDNNNREKVIIE